LKSEKINGRRGYKRAQVDDLIKSGILIMDWETTLPSFYHKEDSL
jgi:hypothetical protein